MAAPKHWGYTREHPIPDELLVAWADGDLIKILDKEIVERLLTHPEERARLAAFARAAEDTATPPDNSRDRVVTPRPGVLDRCRGIGNGDDTVVSAPASPALRLAGRSVVLPLPIGMMVGLGFVLVLTAVIVAWMVRNL